MFYALFAKNLQICTCLFINVNQSNNHDACLALPYSKHGKMFWATTHPFHLISCKNPWQSLLTCCWACANCHHLFFDLVSHIRGSIPDLPPFLFDIMHEMSTDSLQGFLQLQDICFWKQNIFSRVSWLSFVVIQNCWPERKWFVSMTSMQRSNRSCLLVDSNGFSFTGKFFWPNGIF